MPTTSGFLSRDTYAETNPAFCSLLLTANVAGFHSVHDRPMPITFLPLVLPIVMSGELDSTFLYTTADTGLSRWIVKNPDILMKLPARMEACREMTRAALQFALHYKHLSMDNEANLRSLNLALSAIQLKKLGFERTANNATKLGTWFGSLGLATLAYNILGLEA
ncbi:three component ABC system middle component [Massilia luteola]|uniref:three component ABC system middle component n=1 Tax=Massilia luteola TaxID=3081751 RepID=UPI002ACBDBC8|nr:three component ABC system middle component [Massilia sp. Gc5]